MAWSILYAMQGYDPSKDLWVNIEKQQEHQYLD